MKSFFPMRKSEARLLVFLVVIAAISFLPTWRTMEVGGMAVFGWLLAGLMIVSPTLAFLVFRRADRAALGKSRHDKTRPKYSEIAPPPSGQEGDSKT